MTSRKGRRRRSRRIGLTIVAAIGAALLVPAGALATTASISGSQVNVNGDPGQNNGITVDKSGTNFTIVDTGASISAGPGCTLQAALKRVLCPDAGITRVRVFAGNLDDTVNIAYSATTPTTISGGQGADSLDGGPGNDIMSADASGSSFGTEFVRGFGGNDTLSGSTSTPNAFTILEGDDGNDRLKGGPSGGFLIGGPGADDMHGGASVNDSTSYFDHSNPVNVTLDDVANDGEAGENDNVHSDIESVSGGPNDDVLSGTPGADTFQGQGGNDTLNGFGGGDRLDGGPGADTLNGADGNDTMTGGSEADVFNGGADTDLASFNDHANAVTVTLNNVADDGSAGEGDNVRSDVENLEGGNGDDSLNGNGGANVLTGDGGNDTLRGNNGDDRLFGDFQGNFGSPGTDSLLGGGGDDSMVGGPGPDVFAGSTGIDTADYSSASAPQTISIDGVANDGAAGENDNVRTDVEAVIGGSGDDTITGSPNNDVLFGALGNDTLSGVAGNDLFDGEGTCCSFGNDTFDGGPGNDGVSYRSHFQSVTATIDGVANDGQSGETDNVHTDVENLFGSQAGDSLTGSVAGNLIAGGDGIDAISGLDGNDVLAGEGSNDTINGDNGNDQINSRNDSTSDTDNCGADTDSVLADPIDSVNADCETVVTTSPPAAAARGDQELRQDERRLALVERVAALAPRSRSPK